MHKTNRIRLPRLSAGHADLLVGELYWAAIARGDRGMTAWPKAAANDTTVSP